MNANWKLSVGPGAQRTVKPIDRLLVPAECSGDDVGRLGWVENGYRRYRDRPTAKGVEWGSAEG